LYRLHTGTHASNQHTLIGTSVYTCRIGALVIHCARFPGSTNGVGINIPWMQCRYMS